MLIRFNQSLPSKGYGFAFTLVFLFCLQFVFSLTSSAVAKEGAVQSLLERRNENVVRQNFDISCGAAALATILRYQHGETVTEREVALGLIDRTEYLKRPELVRIDRKSTRLNSSHSQQSRMPSSA